MKPLSFLKILLCSFIFLVSLSNANITTFDSITGYWTALDLPFTLQYNLIPHLLQINMKISEILFTLTSLQSEAVTIQLWSISAGASYVIAGNTKILELYLYAVSNGLPTVASNTTVLYQVVVDSTNDVQLVANAVANSTLDYRNSIETTIKDIRTQYNIVLEQQFTYLNEVQEKISKVCIDEALNYLVNVTRTYYTDLLKCLSDERLLLDSVFAAYNQTLYLLDEINILIVLPGKKCIDDAISENGTTEITQAALSCLGKVNY